MTDVNELEFDTELANAVWTALILHGVANLLCNISPIRPSPLRNTPTGLWRYARSTQSGPLSCATVCPFRPAVSHMVGNSAYKSTARYTPWTLLDDYVRPVLPRSDTRRSSRLMALTMLSNALGISTSWLFAAWGLVTSTWLPFMTICTWRLGAYRSPARRCVVCATMFKATPFCCLTRSQSGNAHSDSLTLWYLVRIVASKWSRHAYGVTHLDGSFNIAIRSFWTVRQSVSNRPVWCTQLVSAIRIGDQHSKFADSATRTARPVNCSPSHDGPLANANDGDYPPHANWWSIVTPSTNVDEPASRYNDWQRKYGRKVSSALAIRRSW